MVKYKELEGVWSTEMSKTADKKQQNFTEMIENAVHVCVYSKSGASSRFFLEASGDL